MLSFIYFGVDFVSGNACSNFNVDISTENAIYKAYWQTLGRYLEGVGEREQKERERELQAKIDKRL